MAENSITTTRERLGVMIDKDRIRSLGSFLPVRPAHQ